jgi:hypothetical protein
MLGNVGLEHNSNLGFVQIGIDCVYLLDIQSEENIAAPFILASHISVPP